MKNTKLRNPNKGSFPFAIKFINKVSFLPFSDEASLIVHSKKICGVLVLLLMFSLSLHSQTYFKPAKLPTMYDAIFQPDTGFIRGWSCGNTHRNIDTAFVGKMALKHPAIINKKLSIAVCFNQQIYYSYSFIH